MSADDSLTPGEWKVVGSLTGVFFLRMLGLFLVLPVLSPFASELPGASPLLIGLAVGAFPLTQTLFQVPFGWLSDRFGRKKIIVIGLLLFAGGSLMAALAGSIYQLILAFALQGAGAIGSVVIALVADLTRDSVRTRAMATIGGGIGLALGVGFVAGPLVASTWSTGVLFYAIAVLGCLAILVLLLLVPTPDRERHHDEVQLSGARFTSVLANRRLWTYNSGIFLLNGTLRALFVLLPFLLVNVIAEEWTWLLYLGVLGFSGLVMFPTVFLAERRGFIKQALFGSVLCMAVGLLLFAPTRVSLAGIAVALTFYFVGFSLLEAILPSLVTREVPGSDRGTAVGLFNMSQYLGAFVGSLYGGLFLSNTSSTVQPQHVTLFAVSLGITALLWSALVLRIDVSSPGAEARSLP